MTTMQYRPHLRAGTSLALSIVLSLVAAGGTAAGTTPAPSFLQFDGTSTYVEAPNSPDFSVSTTEALAVSAWIRPDTLTFPKTEGSGYVDWLGKGGPGQYEWTFRMYSQGNTEQRANRISFYVFNLSGGLGLGSYFQQPVTPGEWIHVVAIVQDNTTSIYRDGVYQRCDQFQGPSGGACERHEADGTISPQPGSAPLRIGTLDRRSFFSGSIADVGVWNRALTPDEIAALYAQGLVPSNGLVAYYPLAEGNGLIAYDTTGQHDATIQNGTWISTLYGWDEPCPESIRAAERVSRQGTHPDRCRAGELLLGQASSACAKRRGRAG